MSTYILKVSPNKDLYMEWSTVLGGPVRWGTASELELGGRLQAEIDVAGTSSPDTDFGWEQDTLQVYNIGHEMGWSIPRESFADILDAIANPDLSHLSGSVRRAHEEDILRQYKTD